jgi:hypothetical protein
VPYVKYASLYLLGPDVLQDKPPIWYTKDELYDWLISENYSKQIADELAERWAGDLQHAFDKGWEKAKRYFRDK